MNQQRIGPSGLPPEDADGVDIELQPPGDFLVRLESNIAAAGGELEPDEDRVGSVGATMFDVPNSEDNSLTVLLPREHLQGAPSQALVRIKSPDGRNYLGIVTAGPFAEPDSLRGDSHMLVTVATRGGIFLPPYHGRVQVSILGEELHDGTLVPPRLRPLPNSPAFALDDEESAAVLRADGDIRLGLVAGHENVVVGVPSDQKSVLPRHTAVLGTTGGGKSTTVSRIVQQAQEAGMAVILLDVEGEYTFLQEPTDDDRMLMGLKARGLKPAGLETDKTHLYYLIGRDTANPDHPNRRQFSLQFARLSPYAVIEILGMTEAQQERFLRAYDIAKSVLRDLGIFPAKGNADQERLAIELDEFERGYPRLTLPLIMDVVGACLASVENLPISPRSPQLQSNEAKGILQQHIQGNQIPKSAVSWRALLGRLSRLNRIKVFDPPTGERPLNYGQLLIPGTVSIIDLSDSGASELNNIVIADLLRGLQEAQDEAYEAYERAVRIGNQATPPCRVLLVIEEAHEFLSSDRIDKMQILFQQVARIAKRGRKRWLGLVFVTQLPQQLPRQIFGLVNSYILHKITDPQVVSTLQRTVSGIDESLWRRLPGLAPGQAIVSFPHMARPLLVAVDPTPAKLRLVD
jgi:DNA helicase HerA-like ATPase